MFSNIIMFAGMESLVMSLGLAILSVKEQSRVEFFIVSMLIACSPPSVTGGQDVGLKGAIMEYGAIQLIIFLSLPLKNPSKTCLKLVNIMIRNTISGFPYIEKTLLKRFLSFIEQVRASSKASLRSFLRVFDKDTRSYNVKVR